MNRRRILLQGLKTQRSCIERLQFALQQKEMDLLRAKNETSQWRKRLLDLFMCDMDFQPDERCTKVQIKIAENALKFINDPEAVFAEAIKQLVHKLYRSR